MLVPRSGYPDGPIDIGKYRDGLLPDEDALKLVVQDSRSADSYLNQKQWPIRWREADLLYMSPRPISAWEGTTVPEANVTSFTIAKHVNAIVPQIVNGLFFQDPPFMLRPRPGTDENTIRAKTAVASYQLDETCFKETMEDFLFEMVFQGTSILKWGYQFSSKNVPVYRRKGNNKFKTPLGDVTITTGEEFEVVEQVKDCSGPWIEHIPLEQVKVDPSLETCDIRKAKFVIHVMYLTEQDLNDLRDEPDWEIPDDLSEFFVSPKEQPGPPGTAEMQLSGMGIPGYAKPRYENSTADPKQNVLKVEERWDNEKVIAVLQDKLVIKNCKNTFNKIPFYSGHWWKIRKSFYSMGVGCLVGQDQRVDQGIRNAALNLLGMAVMPTYLRARGANVPTQQIRMRRGGIIDVDGEIEKAFKQLDPPKFPPELFAVLQQTQANSESTSGADQQLVQGNNAGPRGSMGRTAGGASILASASASKLEGPLTRVITNCFQPWLYQMDDLNRELMPMQRLRDILGEELEKGFEVNEEDFLNSKVEYEILAGAHLAAKKAMAQFLPLFTQIVENAQLLQQLDSIGYTLDVKELFEMYFEVSEWRNVRNVIRKLTPEEQQYKQQQMQMAIQAKAAPQKDLENQKAGNKSQLNAQNNDARAVNEVLRVALEHGLESAYGDQTEMQ